VPELGLDASQRRAPAFGDKLGTQIYSLVRWIVQRRRIVVLKNRIPTHCTARGVFKDLRTRVLKDVGRMNQQEHGCYREDPVPFSPTSCRFSIIKEKWDGTVVARSIFDLGHESVTVKRQKGDHAPRIAFRIIPDWDTNTGKCRRALYDDQGTCGDIVDADVKTISELSLRWLRHEGGGPPPGR